jgi:hypothetical protein
MYLPVFQSRNANGAIGRRGQLQITSTFGNLVYKGGNVMNKNTTMKELGVKNGDQMDVEVLVHVGRTAGVANKPKSGGGCIMV